MMLQLCTMAMVHSNNAVWVRMPIIHPKSGYPWWKTADFSHSARCDPYWTPPIATGHL